MQNPLRARVLRRRAQVYVYRHFRQKQTKNEVAVVRIQDLNTKFTKQSETLIRKKIKHCADFQRVGDFAGQWALKARGCYSGSQNQTYS